MDFDNRGFLQTANKSSLENIEFSLSTAEAHDYAKLVGKNERSDAEALYASEEMMRQADEMIKLDPGNKEKYETYKTFTDTSHKLAFKYDQLIKSGDLFINADGKMEGKTLYADQVASGSTFKWDTQQDLAFFVQNKRKEVRLDGFDELVKKSQNRAHEDYTTSQRHLQAVDSIRTGRLW